MVPQLTSHSGDMSVKSIHSRFYPMARNSCQVQKTGIFGCGIQLWVSHPVNHCDTPIGSHASRFLAMGSISHRVHMTTQSGYGMLHLAQRSGHRSKDTALLFGPLLSPKMTLSSLR